MKNKPLKHYKRKKFFYRFFMRKSPQSGAMFGLAWMICFGAILPLAPWLFLKIVPQAKFDYNMADIILWLLIAVALFGSCILVYAYGILTFAKNFYTVLRNDLKKSRWWKFPAVIGAFWWELAGMFLLPTILKKRCWLALIPLLCSFGFVFAGYMVDTPLQKWWCFHFGVPFMLFAAIWASAENKKFPMKTFYPFFGFLFLLMNTFLIDLNYKVRAWSTRFEIEHISKFLIETEDWKIRNAAGYPIDVEPLKSFCKVNLQIDMKEYQTSADARKFLAELRKTHPDKFIAIEKMLELDPMRIAYNWVNEGETVEDLLLPDLQCFRTASYLRNLEIRADAANKTVVVKCNQDMLKFRKWCCCNETLLGKLVACHIEHTRLNALSYAMASGVFSKDEIAELIGDAPDWSSQFSEIFASEHAMVKDVMRLLEKSSYEDIQNLEIPDYTKTHWKFYQKFAPLFVKLNFKRDYLFTLNHYLKINSLFYRDDLSGVEKKKQAYLDREYLAAEFFISSLIAIPDMHNLLEFIERTRDIRQKALLSAEVMEYRKQHGKLPDDLTFLSETPLSKLDHKPLMYEKTKDGFRIFSNTADGKMPDAQDTRYFYQVNCQCF